MSNRLTNEQAAETVDAIWATLTPPPMTRGEMTRAIKKLWRFAQRDTFKGTITFSKRNKDGSFTINAWANRHITCGMKPTDGWQQLVHCCAYWLAKHEGNNDYSYVELLMVREVIKRGWLDGRLADKLIPPMTPAERVIAKRVKKMESVRKRIAQWQSKSKRATNALKKLERELKRLEKLT